MINEFNNYLLNSLSDQTTVQNSMIYSLSSLGKRIRPLMLFNCLLDMDSDYKVGFDAAVALEMIHTYSLVHDDLPAMDNDDYRRGKLTNHKVFGEGIAILAGDALLTYAFEIIANSTAYNDLTKVKLISKLANYSGYNGMILGQELDIQNNTNLTINNLEHIHIQKTGKLFAAALVMAGIITNNHDKLDTLEQLGFNLGLAFQIQDDMLEFTASFEELGKMPSDLKNQKANYLSFLTIEECTYRLETIFEKCYNLIDSITNKTNLKSIVEVIKSRKK